MSNYFTSDTHFGSQRTLELSKRPYNTTEDIDNAFIANWNKTIGTNDTVYHLGDFGNYEVIKKLNGRVFLIIGNYEESDMKKDNILFEDFRKRLINMGFFEVYENGALFSYHNNDIIIDLPMTHCPKDCDRSKFSLFGHIHKLCMVKRYGLNVGLDSHNFKPIDLDTVLFYKNAIEKFYDNNVFE